MSIISRIISSSGGAGGATGPQGPTGPAGPAGTNGINGASTIWLQNNGVTLAPFDTINLAGSLRGTTGPVNGTVTINSLNDFAIMGLTGSNITANSPSGAMVQWNANIVVPTGGALGHTTIGTACGWITIQKEGWYEIDYSLGLTGLAPANGGIMAQCFIGATGGNQRFGFGSGSPIAQSVSYGFAPTGWLSQSFMCAIPSGSSIEMYISRYPSHLTSGITGIAFTPTGSKFSIRTRG